ncbi:AraC family transcriptional regulator [Streptomyces sp. NPDC056161]|uniref:AraC family transcriptional regulator n=1 Tax=Streptomyces sp. NPDC056161 TaxID=3345732 RepID=UPI0035DAFAD8
MADLGPAGVHAAHSTLLELAKAVAGRRFDDAEPLPAPALAQVAKELTDRHLADPGLSPTMPAGELNVSVRTLHRAFAASGESLTAYIRRRRPAGFRASRRITCRRTPAVVPRVAAHHLPSDTGSPSHGPEGGRRARGHGPTDAPEGHRAW